MGTFAVCNSIGATYLCNSQLCSLLGQRQILQREDTVDPGLIYLGLSKRAPGTEFLGKRSLRQNFGIHRDNKRAPGMEFLGKRSASDLFKESSEMFPYVPKIF